MTHTIDEISTTSDHFELLSYVLAKTHPTRADELVRESVVDEFRRRRACRIDEVDRRAAEVPNHNYQCHAHEDR